MKYFTRNQYDNLIIVDLDFELPEWQAPAYTALNEVQLQYLEDKPEATPFAVEHCEEELNRIEAIVEETEEDVNSYRETIIKAISEVALYTAKEKVPDYKVLNAQMSLAVEDGKGIYSYEEANNVIAEYNEIGTICRNKYYEFVEEANKLTTIAEIQALHDETIKYFESL